VPNWDCDTGGCGDTKWCPTCRDRAQRAVEERDASMATYPVKRAASKRSHSTAIARRAPDTVTVSSEGDVEDDEPRGMQRAELPQLDFATLMRMGNELVATGFLPQHIRTGGQAAAIIMTGRELGMDPMRSLRSLSMVKGKVIEDASSQLSRFKVDGGRAQFTTLDDETAELHLTHPNGDKHVEIYTIAMARTAGLAGGDTWRKHTQAMLRSRAITAGLKSLGWEGGTGVYSPDEAVHFDDEPEPQPRPTPRPSSQGGASGPQHRTQAASAPTGGSSSAGAANRSATREAAPRRERTPKEQLFAFLDAVDYAQDDYVVLEELEKAWTDKLKARLDEPDWQVAGEAHVGMALSAANGLTYECSHEELRCLGVVRSLREGRVAAAPVDDVPADPRDGEVTE
jgi:hypothetical protein